MSRLITSLATLSILASAGVAQAAPADYERGYTIGLFRAAIDLHVGLAVATPRGAAAWGDHLTVELDADGIDAAEQAAFQTDLTDGCMDAGLPEGVCAPLAENIAAAVAAFNNGLVEAVPVLVDLDVGSWGWVSSVFGLYPMVGTHETLGGDVVDWGYVVNDNSGTFLSGGLALNAGGVAGSLACADVSAGLISGGFSSGGTVLDADFVADRELMCIGAVEGLVVAGTIGFAFGGILDGLAK